MNDILLLLWLADIAEGLRAGLFLFGGLGAFVLGFVVAYLVVETDRELRQVIAYPLICVFMVFVAALIPSKQWFYIAAGGTAAVKALDSDIGQKVQKLVNQKLDEALEGAKK